MGGREKLYTFQNKRQFIKRLGTYSRLVKDRQENHFDFRSRVEREFTIVSAIYHSTYALKFATFSLANLPYFSLSWILTLLSHDLESLPTIQHVFDFLLTYPPGMVCYLGAAVSNNSSVETVSKSDLS
jgi:hypothetical protein